MEVRMGMVMMIMVKDLVEAKQRLMSVYIKKYVD